MRTDRGQIETAVLVRLGRFHQHAAAGGAANAAARAQLGDAGQHLIGAFRCLDRQHVAAGYDHGLADVERSGSAQIVEAERAVGAVALAGFDAAERALWRKDFRRHFVGAEQAEADLLEQPADIRQ